MRHYTRRAAQFHWRWPIRATLASVTLLVCGCATLKTDYSKYSSLLHNDAIEESETSRRWPPAERTERVADKIAPQVSPPSSEPAASKVDRTNAAAEAAAASAVASKAAEEAAKAATEASRAAARAAGAASPLAQPTLPPPVLSSSDKVDQEPERQHAADKIEALSNALRTIDHQSLSADRQGRVALGEQFLQSAQKALAQGSYAEAASLADKASMMIGPAAATPNTTSP
jgi:hypothetical protein